MCGNAVVAEYDRVPMILNLVKQRGFSLVELAVVLVLIGIIMTMGLKVAVSTLGNAAYSETKSKQEMIKTALIGYFRAYRKLPCPDNSAGVSSGAASATCTANPADGYGVVPWQTLGIPRDLVIDGWGNYFTYRVSNGTGGSRDWTSDSKSSPSAFDINELRNPTSALTIQELDAAGTALVTTTSKAVVVLLSHGKNGAGAKTTKVAARLPTADAGADEQTNATDSTTRFVLRPVNESSGATGGPYDDLLSFMTPQDILQPLLNEGFLKSCYAYCQLPSCPGGGLPNCPPLETASCSGTGAAPICTSGGSPTCTMGAPQCTVPGPGCPATGIPIGSPTTTCS